MVTTAWRLGRPDAYAFQSTDSAEYLALGRSLAFFGRYEQDGVPDTWRVPMYPLFLAGALKCLGDSPSRLVVCQHGLAILNLCLFYLAASGIVGPRRALIAAMLWTVDPFRVYYSGWLLAETLFMTWLLAAGLLWPWLRGTPRPHLSCALLGVVLGLTMLTRPIGTVLPLLAVVGLLTTGGRPWSKRATTAAACAIGMACVVGPWLVRNAAVSGRFAVSHQSGVSFAYFKVVDVLLWEQGLTSERFNLRTLQRFYEEMDARLHARWQQDHGPLTNEQAAEVRWFNLIYGRIRTVSPIDVSRTLWAIGADLLRERPLAAVNCYAARALSLLSYPLAIAVWPPTNAESMPFAVLLGRSHPTVARAIAAVIGAVFGFVSLAVLIRAFRAAVRRSEGYPWFALVAVIGLLMVTVPFEDPRFREPMMPALLLALVCHGAAKTASHRSLAEPADQG